MGSNLKKIIELYSLTVHHSSSSSSSCHSSPNLSSSIQMQWFSILLETGPDEFRKGSLLISDVWCNPGLCQYNYSWNKMVEEDQHFGCFSFSSPDYVRTREMIEKSSGKFPTFLHPKKSSVLICSSLEIPAPMLLCFISLTWISVLLKLNHSIVSGRHGNVLRRLNSVFSI